jgi:hypothetical protein
MNNNTYQTFETVTYNTIPVSVDSITINNPYIDLKGQKIISLVDFNTSDSAKSQIIRSKSALITDIVQYESIFNIDALFSKLETYYNIKPTISAIPTITNCKFIYNPSNYKDPTSVVI